MHVPSVYGGQGPYSHGQLGNTGNAMGVAVNGEITDLRKVQVLYR